MGAAGTGSQVSLSEATNVSSDITVSLGLSKQPTGGGTYLSVLGRAVPGAGDYRFKLKVAANGSVAGSLVRSVSGTETALASTTALPGITYAVGDRILTRFQVEETSPSRLRARAWEAGTAEPATWQLTATDTTASLQAAGSPGVVTYVSGSATNAPVDVTLDDVEVTQPVTTISGGVPEGTTTASAATTFTLDSTRSPATYLCRLDTQAFATCASTVAYSGLADGDHTFEAYTSYDGGHLTPVVARHWTVDTRAPITTIATSGPAQGSVTTATTASFAFSTDETATTECRLDAGAWTACTSPVSYSGLTVAGHTFSARGTDAVGNVEAKPPTRTWTVAAPAPVVGTVQPTASNTGVPTGTKLTPVYGDLTVTTPGAVYDGLDIHGFVNIKAANVTIRNSIVRGGKATGNIGLITNYGYAGLVVEDCTIYPEFPSVWEDGIKGNNFIARRVNVYGTVDTIKIHGDNVRVEASYLHDTQYYASDPNQGGGGSHNDGVQFLGGKNIRVVGNTIIPGANANAAIQITQGYAPVADTVMTQNWVDGGGCTVNVSATPLTSMAMSLTSNRFGRAMRFKNCAIISRAVVSLTSTGNIWSDTGLAVPITMTTSG